MPNNTPIPAHKELKTGCHGGVFGLLALLLLAAMACRSLPLGAASTPTPGFEVIRVVTLVPTPTQSPTETPEETASPGPTPEPTTAPVQALEPTPEPTSTEPPARPTPLGGFMIVRLHPKQGDLASLLETEAEKAAGLGLEAFVEFSATWCPACQAIEENLDHPLMEDAFQGAYIIHLDVDEWNEDQVTGAGFVFEYIPIYFRLDEAGRPTEDFIDGNAWGENIPENMAPPLKEFFSGGER
ncbi:MAG: hypothetical protein EHM70_01710 [Chloroflexota bacterium]|nr:MAG: hypothetical protein EHM70_01710 [Chloroflexota bacterium]